jgi:hypothetical protein
VGSVELREACKHAQQEQSSVPYPRGLGHGNGRSSSILVQRAVNTRTTRLLEDGKLRDDRRGVQHSITVNAAPKLGYFTISPFFNYTEKWYDKQIDRNYSSADDTLYTQDVKAVKAKSFPGPEHCF